ncbi:cytochrome d ubiquinol oxidase subunit II [Marivirga sp. S37H4]|uniref:Cytochrome d ubiquinol oxidase subunit II n=1 Tax=Marivirga aurantiaca TaxID=2802615 RepID=A0A934WZH6_9BACT|nr:cytochrome d ubiquinol oxidase subunit II [Marivirga aurantiaca]MBK6265636.1 cytochrome d ubiquinol oxidase subunit II [Marivirga aurantiaca]
MLYVVIVFLCLSILLYLLLGGADFGAGIVELITPVKLREKMRGITYQTIGPIWEANHMWLIITIVILFVGFPSIYTMLSVHLHIPLLLMLLGIIGRGTAFIFRHYDAVKDDMQRIYNIIFTYSSFITPLFLGVIAGAMVGGKIDTEAVTFFEGYIRPWFNYFSFSVGLFTVAICGFLAAVYLTGEAEEKEIKGVFTRQAKLLNVATVIAGGIVFIAAEIEGIQLMRELVTNPVTLVILLLATASLVLLWHFLGQNKKVHTRLIAGFQVSMILFALGFHYFPDFIIVQGGNNISLYSAAALGKPIETLGWALLIGGVFIIPSLVYLIYSFQRERPEST